MNARDELGEQLYFAMADLRRTDALLDAYRTEVLRKAADELSALANRTTERGSGVLWAADKLRRMADEAVS